MARHSATGGPAATTYTMRSAPPISASTSNRWRWRCWWACPLRATSPGPSWTTSSGLRDPAAASASCMLITHPSGGSSKTAAAGTLSFVRHTTPAHVRPTASGPCAVASAYAGLARLRLSHRWHLQGGQSQRFALPVGVEPRVLALGDRTLDRGVGRVRLRLRDLALRHRRLELALNGSEIGRVHDAKIDMLGAGDLRHRLPGRQVLLKRGSRQVDHTRDRIQHGLVGPRALLAHLVVSGAEARQVPPRI